MAGFRVIEAPDGEPVGVDEARKAARIDDAAERALVEQWIRSGREHVEGRTRRALVTRKIRLTLDAWPSCRVIRLPRPPLVAVTLVQYRDTAGVMQTLVADTDYQVDSTSEPARIKPAYGKTWPATRPGFNAVVVEYTAGYGTAEKVPARAKDAILLYVGNRYAFRETMGTGTVAFELAEKIDDVLAELLRPGADEEAA